MRRTASRRGASRPASRPAARRLLESGPMATPAQWIAGARPRTLPAAVVPGARRHRRGGVRRRSAVWWKAALALVVALALQVGVNYANDYSDGIRGTDDERVGPMRLVGSGAATPRAVKRAAFARVRRRRRSPGLVLAATTAWWLVAVGLVVDRRGLVLHRRQAPLRLPRARRGDGLRVLRAGRGGRHDVRPDRDVRVGGAVRRRRRRARWPARSSSSTTCATSPPTRAVGKRTLAVRLGERADPRPLPAAGPGGRGRRGRRRGGHHVVGPGRAGVPRSGWPCRRCAPCWVAPRARR